MDLIKIGKYIAGKRKAQGLTQKQLAEKLGMSDKSVSKWERGICLPDVSVYLELCDILGISINEFLAGEDIREEAIKEKSEENLLLVTEESMKKQKNQKKIIIGLLVCMLLAVSVIGTFIFQQWNRPKNYITPLSQDSVEMKTAKLLAGVDGAFLFRYYMKDGYKGLTMTMTVYHEGKEVSQDIVADMSYEEIDSGSEGMIAIVPDFETFEVKLVIADNCAKYSTRIPILEHVENRKYYGRTSTQIKEDTLIQYGEEQGVMALIYGENEIRATSVEQLENGDVDTRNEYIYFFSVKYEQ